MNTSNSPTPPEPSLDRSAARWQTARWLLLALGVLVTLVTLFYTEENWRGKRAWEKCRRELEAQGEVLDWAAYIPAPVPAAQNVFAAPHMREWFVKDRLADAVASPPVGAPASGTSSNGPVRLDNGTTSVLLAEVDIRAAHAPTTAAEADSILRLEDPAAPAQLLQKALGPYVQGSANCALFARPLDQLKPAHLVLLSKALPSTFDLKRLLPTGPLASHLQLEFPDPGAFQVWLKVSAETPCYLAADYLAWSDQFATEYDAMRQALERPLARMEGDYENPFHRPIINFIQLRDAAQTLTQRAQCDLLLSQPEAALRELTLVHNLGRLVEAKPASLLSAMIHVAVSSLYVQSIQDGLRLQAWREPQLAELERQLQELSLLSEVPDAFNSELAASRRIFATLELRKLANLYASGRPNASLWKKITHPKAWSVALAPRGWVYQNDATAALANHALLACFDSTNQLVRAHRLDQFASQFSTNAAKFSPYSFLERTAIPHWISAARNLTQNQTLANQALIACALERYRRAHHEYPETLDALVPQFAERLPHDLIGGRPLKYRRTGTSNFLLYSVGWNEKDDRGIPGNTREEGDWVWP